MVACRFSRTNESMVTVKPPTTAPGSAGQPIAQEASRPSNGTWALPSPAREVTSLCWQARSSPRPKKGAAPAGAPGHVFEQRHAFGSRQELPTAAQEVPSQHGHGAIFEQRHAFGGGQPHSPARGRSSIGTWAIFEQRHAFGGRQALRQLSILTLKVESCLPKAVERTL